MHRFDEGFTLIESLIVLSIIIVVSAIAVPGFQKMAVNGTLKAAARDIMADIAGLKQRAMSENDSFAMYFDVPNNHYTIQGSSWSHLKKPTYYANDIKFKTVNYQSSTIKFQTRGTTSLGTLVLTNSRNSEATITTNITGRMHLEFFPR